MSQFPVEKSWLWIFFSSGYFLAWYCDIYLTLIVFYYLDYLKEANEKNPIDAGKVASEMPHKGTKQPASHVDHVIENEDIYGQFDLFSFQINF